MANLMKYFIFNGGDYYRVISGNHIHQCSIHFLHRYNTDNFPLTGIPVRGLF